MNHILKKREYSAEIRNNKIYRRYIIVGMQSKKNHHTHQPYCKLAPVPFQKVKINDVFWSKRQEINRKNSIFAQHRQLEKQGHIDNFRITAGHKKGVTKGLFYLDSDLYKWLEGACYMLSANPDAELSSKVNEVVELIKESQTPDGYVNTFFTTKFLEERFTTTHITHELYCAGHLIQAALAHKNATGKTTLLKVAKRFADLLVHLFLDRKRKGTPGHEEIEMALIKLYRLTGKSQYLNLANEFIQRRGNISHFKTYAMNQYLHTAFLLQRAEKQRERQLEEKNRELEHVEVKMDNEPPEYLTGITLRDALLLIKENLNGKVYQHHKPVRKMQKPVGHAVRAMYLYCGMADLYAETGDTDLLRALELIWLKMLKARMYITGGTGAVKGTEGFGKDFQLDPANSYSETCAAIGNLMWNWRMLQITGKPRYGDLIERLLYNGMLVGQSIDGLEYTYTNPLKSFGNDTRHEWFICACCPPNIARTISSVGKYIYSKSSKGLYIHQYIGNTLHTFLKQPLGIELESHFPWNGDVQIHMRPARPEEFSLFLRVPDWAESISLKLNETDLKKKLKPSSYAKIRRIWKKGDKIELKMTMEPQIIRSDPRIRATRGKIAIRRGPLLYCMEQIDNPGIDIFKAVLAGKPNFKVIYDEEILDGINIIKGELHDGSPFSLIPYYAWCNRGPNKMQVWHNWEGYKK